MTVIRAGLFVLALIGIIAPFKLAQLLLTRLYPMQVTGLPIPLAVSIPVYLAATIIACVVTVICFRLIKKDREPTDKQDGLDNNEEIFY